LWHNNELYVATSEGIYYLKEVKNYTEVEILVKNEGLSKIPERVTFRSTADKLQPMEPQKTRKSIFTQIFGKKSPTPAPSVAAVAQEKERPHVSPPEIKLPEPKYFKKVSGRLKSINYVYKKINGLNEKCKQLVSAGDEILASTNRGLFIISGHIANPIVNRGYINYISAKSKDNRYYIATSEGYFYVARSVYGKWEATYPDKTFSRSIYSITSEDENTVWAGGDDALYRINMNKGISTGSPVAYLMKNNLPQRYMVVSVNDTVFLFSLSTINYMIQVLIRLKSIKAGLQV